MASRVQKIKFWDTFKNAKSVILHFFPVAEIGRNIHLLYFSYPQQIYSQFVEWGKKVLSPYSPQWSVYFPVLLLLITRKHPVYWCAMLGCFFEAVFEADLSMGLWRPPKECTHGCSHQQTSSSQSYFWIQPFKTVLASWAYYIVRMMLSQKWMKIEV